MHEELKEYGCQLNMHEKAKKIHEKIKEYGCKLKKHVFFASLKKSPIAKKTYIFSSLKKLKEHEKLKKNGCKLSNHIFDRVKKGLKNA